MIKTVRITVAGKEIETPENLTIIKAMEHAGISVAEHCGCLMGMCGACACIIRKEGSDKPVTGLACREKVENGMIVAFPVKIALRRKEYDLNRLVPNRGALVEIFPEIYSCVNCGACTKNCTQGIDVRAYIDDARFGDIKKISEMTFNCIACGACSALCPAKINHAEVALLARRITAKYLTPESGELNEKCEELAAGKYKDETEKLAETSVDGLKKLYGERITEKQRT